jgi:hypothetical protein
MRDNWIEGVTTEHAPPVSIVRFRAHARQSNNLIATAVLLPCKLIESMYHRMHRATFVTARANRLERMNARFLCN